jgi:hypothetical protein
VTNGARPPAPVGGHRSQVGTLLDRAVVPVPDEVPDPEPPDVVLLPVPAVLDPLAPLEVGPVAEVPDVVPVAVVVVAGPVWVALAAVVTLVVGDVTAP